MEESEPGRRTHGASFFPLGPWVAVALSLPSAEPSPSRLESSSHQAEPAPFGVIFVFLKNGNAKLMG